MIRTLLEAVKEWVEEVLAGFVKKGNANDSNSITGRYNVLDFGLKGNQSFDNTSAFQNMLATIEDGATVFFPQGVYKFTDSITLSKGVTICGISNFTQVHSTVNITHAQSEIYFAPTVANKSLFVRNTDKNVVISNLSFQCNSYEHTDNTDEYSGIPYNIFKTTVTLENINAVDDSASKGGDFAVRDCVFKGFSGNAVIVNEHQYIKDCAFFKCENSIKTLGTDNLIEGCWFCRGGNAIVGECVTHPNFTNISVSNCWCDQMTDHFIKIVGGTSIQSVLMVNNVWIDALEKSAIYSEGILNHCMINGRFSRCGMRYAGIEDANRTADTKPMCDVIVAKRIDDSQINVIVHKRVIGKWGNPNGICPSRVVSSTDTNKLIVDTHISCPDTLLVDVVETGGGKNISISAKDGEIVKNGTHLYNYMPLFERAGTPIGKVIPPRQGCIYIDTLTHDIYKSTGTTADSWTLLIEESDIDFTTLLGGTLS